ncbi:MAG: ABC transporter permease [Lachnospiraceae bacterium]|nr:ABC transporter permease [Bacillota bacterium]MCI6595060.1 ABC transporter permease [Bacillota bacterium]MDD7253764.1 ABC transporter permease [Bacillota bacterium]MDY2950218.1 ABC transporter permease [Lachnospiraceae bacterium]CCX65706.1 polysaccharide ABC transporter permease protein [Firmicutes bacterium CAG:791]
MDQNRRKKQVVLGTVWTVAIILAAALLLHNNVLEDPDTARLKKISGCLLLGAGVFLFTLFQDRVMALPVELYQNRRLIWRLSRNDFKKRYAGSYLGTIWAMVPPIVTVAMYWVVFDRIFGSGPQVTYTGGEVPYVLFLTAGLVPWFFFSDAVMGGMTSLMEYNYLVKKVVFKVSILPIIKVTAAMFVHIGFSVVLVLIAAFYGYTPTVYTLQLFYYTFCEYVFILGLSYATCAIVLFFRDLQNLVSIIMQVGMWATPILWNINTLREKYKPFIKLNPMTYIVEGYRSAVYEQQWFWEHFYSSTYFWIVTALLFVVSALIFKKLKPMFADVM